MNTDPRGTIITQGGISRINNALVEDASCSNNSNGFILISYAVRERNTTSIQNIRLNLTRNTIILNSSGQNMCMCCIQKGMWVNVVFSSRLTRSIPPQSTAYLVMVLRNSQQPQPPRPPQRPGTAVTTGRIVLVDFDNNYFITANPDNINEQTRFNITQTTAFTNRFGGPVRFGALQPGQLVRVTHANFQTPSIPPQTTAFQVRIL